MAAADNSGSGLKSAYEAALEKLESQGISRPDDEALSSSARKGMAEARRRRDAKLAEVEIMHRDSLTNLVDPVERSRAEERYLLDRARIEETLESAIARLRSGSDTNG